MTFALVLQVPEVQAPAWLMALSFALACFGIVAFLRWSEFAPLVSRSRLLMATAVLMLLASPRLGAVIFMPDAPCRVVDWDQLVEYWGTAGAYFWWYFVFGCS